MSGNREQASSKSKADSLTSTSSGSSARSVVGAFIARRRYIKGNSLKTSGTLVTASAESDATMVSSSSASDVTVPPSITTSQKLASQTSIAFTDETPVTTSTSPLIADTLSLVFTHGLKPSPFLADDESTSPQATSASSTTTITTTTTLNFQSTNTTLPLLSEADYSGDWRRLIKNYCENRFKFPEEMQVTIDKTLKQRLLPASDWIFELQTLINQLISDLILINYKKNFGIINFLFACLKHESLTGEILNEMLKLNYKIIFQNPLDEKPLNMNAARILFEKLQAARNIFDLWDKIALGIYYGNVNDFGAAATTMFIHDSGTLPLSDKTNYSENWLELISNYCNGNLNIPLQDMQTIIGFTLKRRLLIASKWIPDLKTLINELINDLNIDKYKVDKDILILYRNDEDIFNYGKNRDVLKFLFACLAYQIQKNEIAKSILKEIYEIIFKEPLKEKTKAANAAELLFKILQLAKDVFELWNEVTCMMCPTNCYGKIFDRFISYLGNSKTSNLSPRGNYPDALSFINDKNKVTRISFFEKTIAKELPNILFFVTELPSENNPITPMPIIYTTIEQLIKQPANTPLVKRERDCYVIILVTSSTGESSERIDTFRRDMRGLLEPFQLREIKVCSVKINTMDDNDFKFSLDSARFVLIEAAKEFANLSGNASSLTSSIDLNESPSPINSSGSVTSTLSAQTSDSVLSVTSTTEDSVAEHSIILAQTAAVSQLQKFFDPKRKAAEAVRNRELLAESIGRAHAIVREREKTESARIAAVQARAEARAALEEKFKAEQAAPQPIPDLKKQEIKLYPGVRIFPSQPQPPERPNNSASSTGSTRSCILN